MISSPSSFPMSMVRMRHLDEWGLGWSTVMTGWKGVFNIQPVFREDLLCARLCTGALGYIGEQRFLLSWNLYSSKGRETINTIVSCVC